MDEYQIMELLLRLDIKGADPDEVRALFVETLANVSARLTDDEMRRFLLCGAFIQQCSDRNSGRVVLQAIEVPSGVFGPH